MRPPSYMRSVVDQKVVMRHTPVVGYRRLESTCPSYLQDSNSSRRMVPIGCAEKSVTNCPAYHRQTEKMSCTPLRHHARLLFSLAA